MDCSKVGELIRLKRIENGLTQKQLADAMNISDKTISKCYAYLYKKSKQNIKRPYF